MSSQRHKIERATKALLKAGKLPEHKKPEPTAKDLKRKFVMRTDRKGKPTIKEVE